MSKETYLTEKNVRVKIKQWQQIFKPYKKRWKTFTLENSALLVIDLQNYFLDEESHAFVPSSKIVLNNTIRLINFFRKHQKTIIFTYFAVRQEEDDPIRDWWNDTVIEGSKQSKIVRELQQKEQDLLIRKSTYSPFYKTELEDFLRKKNIKNLMVTGVLTNFCYETAVREAFDRNFIVFLPIDATATYNEELHIATLKNLSQGFATLMLTEEVLK